MDDFRGSIRPLAVASLPYLDVRGMMSSADVQAAARYGWTKFNASIGVRPLSPGHTPKDQTANAFWVVHSQLPRCGLPDSMEPFRTWECNISPGSRTVGGKLPFPALSTFAHSHRAGSGDLPAIIHEVKPSPFWPAV